MTTAYFGIKFYEVHRNNDEIIALTAVLENDGIESVCMARDVEKWGDIRLSVDDLMKVTFQQIDDSDFVILEMSEKGVGLGIEAGYTVAKAKSLIILIKDDRKLSNAMRGVADVVI